MRCPCVGNTDVAQAAFPHVCAVLYSLSQPDAALFPRRAPAAVGQGWRVRHASTAKDILLELPYLRLPRLWKVCNE